MSSQRPFFLTTFFAAFRHQPPPLSAQPPNKHPGTQPSTSSTYGPASASSPRTISTQVGTATQTATSPAAPGSRSTTTTTTGGVIGQLPLHSPRSHHHHHHHVHGHGGIPIPVQRGGRRRGSNSSSEGFRDAPGVDKLYIGGRTATGEEKFFKLGVVRRVRSGDRLSLDRLSL
ncbi:hypothetical protein B0H67DRAFT_553852 [Lasiosphaeris hirsuta]|uniref:Uncharacterized protein n=1 Tax=Lasiosphaeris hirsuta TaxID=260670 RepID=A0AA40AG98_9PEZI|nr:hypothetical protein B0H67DRAFT_553852 [Lasiosphaeris hirsuta]